MLLLTIPFVLLLTTNTFSQTLDGNWIATYDQNVDGKMLKDKDFAVLEVKMGTDGTVNSTIKTLLNGFSTSCMKCPTGYTGKPTVGLIWCKGMKPAFGRKGEYEGGWAVDPQTGETLIEVRAKMTSSDLIELTGKSESRGNVLRTFKLRRQ